MTHLLGVSTLNSSVNHFMGKSLSAILKDTVESGLIVENLDPMQDVDPLTHIVLNTETNQFLENQSIALNISKHDLINLILDSVAESTLNQRVKVPSRWSVF